MTRDPLLPEMRCFASIWKHGLNWWAGESELRKLPDILFILGLNAMAYTQSHFIRLGSLINNALHLLFVLG